MIPYKNRFHGHSSLDYTYRRGQSTRSKFFNIKTIPNKKRTESRIAVVVSKKIYKSAVRRNLIRRRVYEYLRPLINQFDQIRDVVIIITNKEFISLSHQELLTQFDQVLDQAGIVTIKSG